MDKATFFDYNFSNAPEWEKGKTYYESDIVSYRGDRYEVIKNIVTAEVSPGLCADYKILKKGIRDVE